MGLSMNQARHHGMATTFEACAALSDVLADTISAMPALSTMPALSFANDVAITEVAGDLIARRLRLTGDRHGRAQEVGA